MSFSKRSQSHSEQLLLDWSSRERNERPSTGNPDEGLFSGPIDEAPAAPSADSKSIAKQELSPGAAAIIHGHLPPPDLNQRIESFCKEADTRNVQRVGVAPEADRRTLVQVLPWDFRTSFPDPLEDAINSGKVQEDDATPENIRGLHDEHARLALVLLSDLDAVLDARRRGVDPQTGRTPRTSKQRDRLEVLFRNEPTRLEREFEILMDVYEEAFGADAVNAFRKAILAWHAGIEVISGEAPLAAPLSASIDAGAFGTEEEGAVVAPTEQEVDAITERVTEQLMSLPDGPERRTILSKYAEDFGNEAAQELDRWSRLKPDEDDTKQFTYGPGHPWHYYHEGDANDPLPLESIPARPIEIEQCGVKWPKNPAKRRALMAQTLDGQRKQLAEDECRYEELVNVGVEALSRYDREIAHGGNDDLAWASAIALTYTHISMGRGRIKCLEEQLGIQHTHVT